MGLDGNGAWRRFNLVGRNNLVRLDVDNEFKSVSLLELGGVIMGSAFLGFVRFLYLLRQGRAFKWFDIILEPCLAVIGGTLMWGVNEATKTPDLMQAVLVSLGAWGGPRTIHYFERKYMGGSRRDDKPTVPGELTP